MLNIKSNRKVTWSVLSVSMLSCIFHCVRTWCVCVWEQCSLSDIL